MLVIKRDISFAVEQNRQGFDCDAGVAKKPIDIGGYNIFFSIFDIYTIGVAADFLPRGKYEA